jgi:CheY-like chemotaxis protein
VDAGAGRVARPERLKASPQTAHVPVLAITAQGAASDGGRARAAGCEVLLHKPCDPDDLLHHIRRVLGRRVRCH